MTALPMSPLGALCALLRTLWRQHRCTHEDWTPLDGPCKCGWDAW